MHEDLGERPAASTRSALSPAAGTPDDRPGTDQRLTLRPVAEDELALIGRLTSDPSATGRHEWYGWQDPGQWRRRWAETGLLSEDGGTLIAVADEQQLGFVVWRKHQTTRTSYCWNVGVALVPEARGRGWGTAAQGQLARYLFAHTQANRIEAVTDVGNLAEQRALAKAGFTREGALRGYAFKGGRWHDAVLYSILRADVDLIDEPDEQPQQPSSRGISGNDD